MPIIAAPTPIVKSSTIELEIGKTKVDDTWAKTRMMDDTPGGGSFSSQKTLTNNTRFGFQVPAYRSKQATEKFLASQLASMEFKDSLDGIQGERSQRILKGTSRKERHSLLKDDDDSFEDQPTKRESKLKKDEAPSKKLNSSSYLEQPSIMENVEEVGNFELMTRICKAYYENISFSFRRILLKLGTKVDKQRDAEIRRQKAMTNNILSKSSQEIDSLEEEISKIDRQNFLNVVIMAFIVIFILTLLFR